MKKNRKRYNGNTNRRYDINSNIDYRTFNDWDILEHRTGGTSTLQAEIEALQNSDIQQSEQLKEQQEQLDQQSVLIDQQSTLIDTKQDKLIAGDNITIENNIISATGSTEEKHLYQHNCSFYGTNGNLQIINGNFVYYDTQKDCDKNTAINFLVNNGYIETKDVDIQYNIHLYPATGSGIIVLNNVRYQCPLGGVTIYKTYQSEYRLMFAIQQIRYNTMDLPYIYTEILNTDMEGDGTFYSTTTQIF